MGAWLNLLLEGTTSSATVDEGKEFVKGLLQVLQYVLLAACAGLTLYAVYIFFAMATATDEGKRRSAKGRIFKVGASVFVTVVLVIILQGYNLSFRHDTNKLDGPGDGGNNNEYEIKATYNDTLDLYVAVEELNVTKLDAVKVPVGGGQGEITKYRQVNVEQKIRVAFTDRRLGSGSVTYQKTLFASGVTLRNTGGTVRSKGFTSVRIYQGTSGGFLTGVQFEAQGGSQQLTVGAAYVNKTITWKLNSSSGNYITDDKCNIGAMQDNVGRYVTLELGGCANVLVGEDTVEKPFACYIKAYITKTIEVDENVKRQLSASGIFPILDW